MTELPVLRFIPFRRTDILAMCLAESALDAKQTLRFEHAREYIEDHFRQDFHTIRHALKDMYAPVDPDADTRVVSEFRTEDSSLQLAASLETLLNRANYDRVSDEGLERALSTSSLFQIRLHVDLDDFDEVLLFTRGATRREETVRELFGLWRRKVRFTNYDRVVLYLRLKDDMDGASALGSCQPGSTVLKLFQNVPEADIEMLFPNIRVGMRLLDRLMIGIPAVISGAVVLTTKLGATLILLGSLIGFWLGMHSDPVVLDKTTTAALGAGVVALGGYLWKQLSNFRNRKLKYTQALTENLYFKLLDNNAGALFRVLDEAEESEVKESLLAYYFLLANGQPMTAQALDAVIEAWFERRWDCRLDFEIDDALGKLRSLQLAQEADGVWRATTW